MNLTHLILFPNYIYILFFQTIKAENKALEQNISFRDNPTFVVLDVNEAGKQQGKDRVDNKPSSPSGKPPTKGREISDFFYGKLVRGIS